MKLDVKSISILGLLVNFLLAAGKLAVGLFTGSVAVMAEGIHSGVDVFSSAVAFWGIKTSQKPADEKHPYGYARYEAVASLVVVLILFLGALWILLEAGGAILKRENLAEFSLLNVSVMLISVVFNEIMARLKFKIGGENNSLVLVADGEHDRADVISSAAVLTGVVLTRWIPLADAVLAVAVGAYIIYEAVGLTRETLEFLVDTSNPELEEKIKKFLKDNNFNFESIKTRKIGAANFAEINLLCDARAKIEEVDGILKDLEKRLLEGIAELSYVTLSVKSHEVSSSTVRPRSWGRFRYRREGFKLLGPSKEGRRIIIPLDETGERISLSEFGVKRYLLVDVKEGEIVKKEIVENPYFSEEAGRGVRFAKSVSADRVIVRHISERARGNLGREGIEIEMADSGERLDDILSGLNK